MIFTPLLLAVAFLGPPAAVGGVYHGRIVHALRPAHVQPVYVGPQLRIWWQATRTPPVSRAASRVS